MELQTHNAKIESTFLGFDDHGFMMRVDFEWPGSGQSLCIFIDSAKPIRLLLKAVGAESWEKLKSQYVRIRHDWNHIEAIGHIIEDNWFTPNEDLNGAS